MTGAVFIQNLPDDLQLEAMQIDGVETLIESLAHQGAQAWPELSIKASEFARHLALRAIASPPKKGLAQWLEHVQPADFHLAQACHLGLPGAIVSFEDSYKKDLNRLIRKYSGPDLLEEDLLQQLREKLFVSTKTRAAKICSYSGQGLLQNWLRVTAARTCIDMLRSSSRRQDKEMLGNDDKILNMPDTLQDLELDFLKREYRSQFKEAFSVAVQDLNPHERNLLRQHLIHQLTVEQLGKLYGVHASTISRRVTKARETLLSSTRREFMNRLKLSTREFDSIMGIIRSRLDLSMPRLLQSSFSGGTK